MIIKKNAGIDFHQITEDNYDFMLQTRRHLHRHPELSGEEFETAAYIRGFLDLWGIPYEVIAETSTVATIQGAFFMPAKASVNKAWSSNADNLPPTSS